MIIDIHAKENYFIGSVVVRIERFTGETIIIPSYIASEILYVSY